MTRRYWDAVRVAHDLDIGRQARDVGDAFALGHAANDDPAEQTADGNDQHQHERENDEQDALRPPPQPTHRWHPPPRGDDRSSDYAL